MRFYLILTRLTKISLTRTYFQIGKDVSGKKNADTVYENVKNHFSRHFKLFSKVEYQYDFINFQY